MKTDTKIAILWGLILFGFISTLFGYMYKEGRDSSQKKQDRIEACENLNPFYGDLFVVKEGPYSKLKFTAVGFSEDSVSLKINPSDSNENSKIFYCSDLLKLPNRSTTLENLGTFIKADELTCISPLKMYSKEQLSGLSETEELLVKYSEQCGLIYPGRRILKKDIYGYSPVSAISFGKVSDSIHSQLYISETNLQFCKLVLKNPDEEIVLDFKCYELDRIFKKESM